MTEKLEYSAADMASAAAGGWRDGQRAAAEAARAAGVPDVSAMARVLCDRSADACNVDRDDNWAVYGQEYIEDVQAMLAAAPQPSAVPEYTSAMGAAAQQYIDECCRDSDGQLLITPPRMPGTFFWYELYARMLAAAAPAQPEAHHTEQALNMVAPDQSEVQRLREALRITRDTIDRQLEVIASRAPGNYLDKLPVVSSLKAHRARCDAALAASTGQETNP